MLSGKKQAETKWIRGEGDFAPQIIEHGTFCTNTLLCLLPTSISAEELVLCEVAEIGDDKKYFFLLSPYKNLFFISPTKDYLEVIN